ncbi:beta-1,4-xylanase [Flammeovirgaceae bacterium 311]|nr:beta-1,4-xylanase [Flammeovirgaceae bacterium 311]
MAAGQSKFVGNIFRNTVPPSFNTYWNQVTPENSGKWGTVEGARDIMKWTDLDLAYNHAQNNGFPFKQHAFVWGMQEPSWVSSLPPAEQAAEVEEWIQLYAARYPNTDMIDVVNEPLHHVPSYAEAIGGSGATGWDWVVWSFEKARQYMPNAKLILNDYGILGKRKATTDYINIINILKERNLIDGIGVQAHGLEYAQNSAIKSTLDNLAATGIPIYISELDLELADDTEQLNRYKSLFPLLYEHPGVVGVTLWGYIAGQHWKPDAYLLGQTNTIGSQTLTSTFQNYTFSGSGDIQVHLTNDDVDNTNDMEVDYVILDGITYQAEDMEINTGVWQDNSCGGSFSQLMNCNGYIQFPAASQSITIRARGVNGTENLEVHAVDMTMERPALQWLRYEYFGEASNSAPTASFSATVTDLTAAFDASASFDSDGTISSYAWDFGDGSTGSGELANHSFSAYGNYTVTLTVTDNGGAVGTSSQLVSVSDGSTGGSGSTLHVQKVITYTLSAGAGSKYGVAEVTIHDDQENPVSNATVSGTFSGTFTETASGQTGADGVVVLQTTSSAKGSVTVKLCVDNVTHASYSYDASQDDISCTAGAAGARMATTSEPEKATLLPVRIYPNPSKDGRFTINLPEALKSTQPATLELSIYNQLGMLVYHDNPKNSATALIVESSLQPGIYLLKIRGEKGSYQSRLIISK